MDIRRDSKGLPIDDRGWPIMEVVDYDPVAEKAKREDHSRMLAEHSRLRDQVVEKAAKWKSEMEGEFITAGEGDELFEYERELVDSIAALAAFETEHGLTK